MEGCVAAAAAEEVPAVEASAGAEAASVACAVYAKAATDVVAALCRLRIKNYYRFYKRKMRIQKLLTRPLPSSAERPPENKKYF